MDIQAFSGAATVALTSTIFFLLVAKSWNALTRTVGSNPKFADSIMREAAQRFRDEVDRLSSSQSIYLGAALVFVLLFVAAYVLQAQDLFLGYPAWQLNLQLIFLTLAAGFAAYRLGSTVLARRQMSFLRDANVAIGHQLHQITSGSTRVFHDVVTSAGIVDHIVIGQSGIYAVNVVAHRAHKRGSAILKGNEIRYSNSKATDSIVELAAKTSRIEKEFRQVLGHNVRVRSVIALPGWDIGEQTNENHLLVNERTIAMLRGWKDQSDYLMNEDVDELHRELTERCRRRRQKARS